MTEEKKKVLPILGLVLCAVLLIASGSYAYWQLTSKQKNKNVVGTACLNVTFGNESGDISFNNAYPVTDIEGASGEPYTFTLTNECNQEVNYVIGLESVGSEELESSEYLDYKYIRVKFDDDDANNYSNYGEISDDITADYVIRDTKELNHHTLAPHESATHELRLWIDEDTPLQNEDQTYNTNKYFYGKVKIVAGQNIDGDIPEVATNAACFSFDSETGTITGYIVGENCPIDVVIPSKINSVKVKTIGSNAFANSGLTSVIIPESVTEIEENAFTGNQLTSVTISKKVTSIGSNAFANNAFASEESIIIESNEVNLATRFDENWMEIGFPEPEKMCYTVNEGVITDYNADCPKDVVIPSSIKEELITAIGENAFAAKGLTSVTIPSEITEIGQGAFQNNQLTSITIPASTTTIGDGAFAQNSFADSSAITIGKNTTNRIDRFNKRWTQIGFPGSGPEDVPDPTDVSCFDFDSETGTITYYNADGDTCPYDVVIPSTIEGVTVTTIGDCAFQSTNVTSVYIPYTVTTIEQQAFETYELSSVIFQNTATHRSQLTTIGDYAFDYNQLTSVIIPSSVTTIKDGAFIGNQIVSVTFEDTEEHLSQLTSIGYDAFSYNQIAQVVIPSEVTTIEDYAFGSNLLYNAANVEIQYNQTNTVDRFDENWTNIGFPGERINSVISYDCFKVDGDIPSKIVDYDKTCSSDVVIPSSLNGVTITSIGDGAFAKKGLTSVTIPFTITNIGSNAFASNQITSLTFEDTEEHPSGLISIGNNAFYGNNLTSITIPSSVTTIGESAFDNNQFDSALDVTIEYNSTNSQTRFNNSWKSIGFPDYKYGCYYIDHNNKNIISGYDSTCSKDVVIPSTINGSPITQIGNEAFQNKGLTSVTIPSSVTTIRNSAFNNNKLTSVTIPDNVTYIGSDAFSNNSLASVTIPDSVTYIGTQAFYNNRLTSVTIPASISYLYYNTFAYNNFSDESDITINYNDFNVITRFNNQWSNIGFPGTGAGGNLKQGCFYIDPNNSGKIIDYAVDGDECGYDVEIPSTINGSTITEIGTMAFQNKGLTSVIIPNTVTVIGGYYNSETGDYYGSFEGNYLEELIIPSSVRTIGPYAFSSNQLTSVTIPSSVTTIGSSAFYDNQLIEAIFEDSEEHPSQLTSIGDGAFYYNQLEEITIPSSVTTMGTYYEDLDEWYYGSFDSNNFSDENDITIGYNDNNLITRFNEIWNEIGFPGSGPKGVKYGCYTVAGNIITDYDANGTTCPYNVEIPSTINSTTITEIAADAFSSKNLTSVTIPNTIISIGDSAFYNNQLTSVTFEDTIEHPSQLTTIGRGAFNSNILKSVTIPSSVITIDNAAFASNNFSYENVREDVIIIQSNETNLSTRFDSNWLSIGFPKYGYMCFTVSSGTITGYDSICSKNVTIPSTINNTTMTEIAEEAFRGKNLTSVTIPNTIISIGDSAFYNNQLTSVTFEDTIEHPSQLTTIGRGAFNSNKLKSVTIPSSVITIGQGAFSYNQLTNVTISSSVTSIEYAAFLGNQLTSVTFVDTQQDPSQLEQIGGRAFYMNQLTSLTIPSSVTTIGEYAFSYNQLISVTFKDTVENRSRLTTIENHAFESNQLTGIVVIPGSITTIGGGTFMENVNISEIVIKRANGVGIDFGAAWNRASISSYDYFTVTYDPNYGE